MRRARRWLPTLVWLGLCLRVPGGEGTSCVASELSRARARYEAQPASAEAAWQYGRACFDAGAAATNKTERAAVAEQGIAACRHGLAQQSDSAPLHYYLALNLGQLAETRGFSALKLVEQLEEGLLKAAALDAKLDHAGPDRTLGMLYRDAPVIISVGSRSKSREHLRRAVALAPNWPENRLELIRGYVKWNDRNAARKELEALVQTWSQTRSEFDGEKWAADRSKWEAEIQEFKQKLDETSKLKSPRD